MRALTDPYDRIGAVLAIATIAAAKPPGQPQPPPSPAPLCEADEESSASDVARRVVRKTLFAGARHVALRCAGDNVRC
jgi:hypothetical protein